MKDKALTLTNARELFKQVMGLLALNPSKKYRLSIVEWRKRSLSASNLQHVWYAEIASHKKDTTALDVKNFCKDAFGLPILLNSKIHGDKMEFLLHKLDYYRYDHENRLKLIQCLQVTSLFNTEESNIYMDQLEFYFNENGIGIKYPESSR
tara:strand:- start:32543 stop:32995 length:453 start_codon:yes stop_codon:yes gene_type:complete